MGAACTCTDMIETEEFVMNRTPSEKRWEHDEIFGQQNFPELGEIDCNEKFKNKYEIEAGLKLTCSALTLLF